MSSETYNKTFTVSDTPTIKIGNIRGEINVSPGEDGLVSVTVTRHPGTGFYKSTDIVTEQNDEGHVIIKATYPDRGILLGFLSQPERIDFSVTAPKNSELSVKTVSGKANVTGLSGNIEVESVSGSLLAEEVAGTLKLGTVSGKIEGRELTGPLTLKSVSGKVDLHQSNIPTLKADTVSGNLTLETPLGEGPYQVGSVSGQLVLVVPDGTNYTANISTVSGRVHTNLPDVQVWKDGSPGRHHQRVTIGEGGPEISLKSVSGSLRIVNQVESAESEKPSPVTVETPKPKEPAASKMEVLERIAHGELSVDDAINALQS